MVLGWRDAEYLSEFEDEKGEDNDPRLPLRELIFIQDGSNDQLHGRFR